MVDPPHLGVFLAHSRRAALLSAWHSGSVLNHSHWVAAAVQQAAGLGSSSSWGARVLLLAYLNQPHVLHRRQEGCGHGRHV